MNDLPSLDDRIRGPVRRACETVKVQHHGTGAKGDTVRYFDSRLAPAPSSSARLRCPRSPSETHPNHGPGAGATDERANTTAPTGSQWRRLKRSLAQRRSSSGTGQPSVRAPDTPSDEESPNVPTHQSSSSLTFGQWALAWARRYLEAGDLEAARSCLRNALDAPETSTDDLGRHGVSEFIEQLVSAYLGQGLTRDAAALHRSRARWERGDYERHGGRTHDDTVIVLNPLLGRDAGDDDPVTCVFHVPCRRRS